MQHRAAVAAGKLAAASKNAQGVVLAHGAGGQRHARRETFTLEPPAGDGDMHVLDGDARHALGLIDRRADAVLGAVEMRDRTAFQALRAVMAEA